MKKFKLMLVAFMAMIGTVAFAQQKTDGKLKFLVTGTNEVTITGFATSVTAANRAELIIPNTITDISDDESPAYKVVAVASKAFKDETAITSVTFAGSNLVSIGEAAFSGCTALKTASFAAATKLATIDKDAFKGTIIEELDLSKTAVVTIYNLFGTTPKHAEVKWTAGDATAMAAYNSEVATTKGVDMAVTGTIAAAQANAWNATLPGALVVNSDASKNKFTAETAAAYNAILTGAVKADDAISDANKALYNTSLTDAFNYRDVTYVTAEKQFTAIGAAYYDTYVSPGATKAAKDAFTDTEKTAADTYNAGKTGALTGTNFTAALATTYNALLDGAVKAGGSYATTEANKYNATLKGAVANDGTVSFGSTTVTVDDFNAKFGFAKVGDVRYEAVTAVTNSTLTSVSLPATWTTFTNTKYDAIVAGVFENCTKLATINFGTPATGVTAQALSTRAFVNTALTALDFTGTKITGTLPANLMVDGVDTKTNGTLATVTLNGKDGITNLNGSFAGCTKLTAIDLTNLTISTGEFKGSGLTAVVIPATYTSIPVSAFEDCTALATVTFAPVEEGKTWTFTKINSKAFANTALTAFTAPNVLDVETADGVDANAFADCSKLTSFTFKPTFSGSPTIVKVVNDQAFLGCEDGITFYTVKEYAEAAAVAKKAPTHSTFSYDASPAEDPTEAKELTAKAFKQTSKAGMYFVKYNSMKQNIKIAKSEAKVYAAYNDDADGTIIMQAFKPAGGYYHIAAGDNVLILSSSEKIPYETTTITNGTTFNTDGSINVLNDGSSWLANAAKGGAENMLRYVSDEAGVKRSTLEAQLTGKFAGFNIYAWANTTDFTGWKKITSGSTFPQNTLYIFAKPAAAAEGVRVIWLDENGNIEEETTAIQGIESVEEAGNGASYNLAGQKVNAAYKGVVIKDGKKYMMK